MSRSLARACLHSRRISRVGARDARGNDRRTRRGRVKCERRPASAESDRPVKRTTTVPLALVTPQMAENIGPGFFS
jgi:hypothetical protein